MNYFRPLHSNLLAARFYPYVRVEGLPHRQERQAFNHRPVLNEVPATGLGVLFSVLVDLQSFQMSILAFLSLAELVSGGELGFELVLVELGLVAGDVVEVGVKGGVGLGLEEVVEDGVLLVVVDLLHEFVVEFKAAHGFVHFLLGFIVDGFVEAEVNGFLALLFEGDLLVHFFLKPAFDELDFVFFLVQLGF